MNNMKKKKSLSQPLPKSSALPRKKRPYSPPAILYQGFITTRAGSPIGPQPETFDLIEYLTGKK